MKSNINYHVLDNTIVLNYDGKTELIAKGDSRFEPALKAIKDEQLGGLRAIVTSVIDYLSNNGLHVEDGLVKVEGETLPSELNDRILAFQKEGLPFKHLLKFWSNLKQNPSFNSRQMLFQFLEHNGHPITKDGCFIAYRGVSSDFKDCRTGTFDNSVGSICSIPRDQVDDNPNNTCSYGLHVACFEYAKTFGTNMIEVRVNPKNVVCVPTDYNGTKMRVCEFEVVQVCEKILDEQLYSKDDSELEVEDEKLTSCHCCGCSEYEDNACKVYSDPKDCIEDSLLEDEPKVEDLLNPNNVRFEKTVSSSVIDKIEYRGSSLTVDLASGERYRYKVPANIASDFLKCTSKGTYYNTEIKGIYTSKKLA